MDMEETWIRWATSLFIEILTVYFSSHDSEELTSIEFCQGDACFEKKFNYEASDEQIEALKVSSEVCYQG